MKRNYTHYWLPLTLIAITACSVGPDYVRPEAAKPAVYKEVQNWKQASPNDNIIRGNWWEMFNDVELNKLEEQINISNQNVIQAEAQYRQAKALVVEAEATYFPFVTANADMTRSATGVNGNNTTTGRSLSGSINNQYSATLSTSWEPDIWGKIRRTVEENRDLAQASAAEIGAAKLSAQGTLAVDYLSLRIADEQERLLHKTVEDYKRNLNITNNLYKSGVDARSDFLQAKAQLEATQAQEVDVGVVRAQYEHAIALLIGKAPADLTIAKVEYVPALPAIPVGVPSELLERRPDIASAERQVAAANAQIGVVKAAYYPNITLSASGGFETNNLSQWFSWPSRVWSIGPSIAETVFDAGLRAAQTRAAVAAYDANVAAYRQTVLGAFQGVEDNLAALRILEQEEGMQQAAVKDATVVTNVFINQYKAGLVNYLSVTTAENTQLSDELAALNIRKARLTDAATLIEALGGDWNVPAKAAPVAAVVPGTAEATSVAPPTTLQLPAPVETK